MAATIACYSHAVPPSLHAALTVLWVLQNGVIDPEEAAAVCPKEFVAECIKEIDKDADGKLSLTEFVDEYVNHWDSTESKYITDR